MLAGNEQSENEPTLIAVGLAKSGFEVAVSLRPGQVRLRRRLNRKGAVATRDTHFELRPMAA